MSKNKKTDELKWVHVEEELPNDLETVWLSNGKGWTSLGCLCYIGETWCWAATNGVIYQEGDKIVSECETEDLDVKFWHKLPEAPKL